MGISITIKQKATAWTAVFAVLLMMLTPTLSRVFLPQNAGSTFWMEVCSVFGDRKTDTPLSGDAQHGSAAHCPYCLMHADALTPPPALALHETVFSISQFLLPRLFYRASQPLFAW